MTVYHLDPLEDRRWSRFVAYHPRASVFHTRGWLDALKRTYGYKPIALTTCDNRTELRSALVFCEVHSWLTGSRLVSLPFSDHSEPLVDDADEMTAVLDYLQAKRTADGWRYVELRPIEESAAIASNFQISEQYLLQSLDLRPEIEVLFRGFHKSSTQRKILRAEREALSCEAGRSVDLLRSFYRLLVLTRRRHGLPPQPFEWFRNLAECVGDAMTVRVARYRGQPVAGIVTLRHGATVVYKYGASDPIGHPLGAMHILFWKAIQDARANGCVSLDLGRTDLGDTGLLRFKERWGATVVPLRYWRCPVSLQSAATRRDWMVRHGVRHVPNSWRVAVGKALYKHFG
jgi:CelD/BcsL family acetyltransferase involved in cellulose biosynthesis